MKYAVRFYTKTGNTKRLAEAIADELGVEALPLSSPVTEPVDILFLGNSYYAFNIDPEVRAFADEIMFSEECDARALSDEEFLNWFYLGALNREADEAGLQYNIGLLADGMSREDLVNNIMSAPGGEFEVFCNSIGVAPY